MFSNKKVFVTGATGFIGGRMIERLVIGNQNNKILALVRDFSRLSRICRFSGFEAIEGDVLDSNRIHEVTKGCDYVFHCAFGNRGDEMFRRRVTVDGTRNVCEAALKNKNKLIYLSTISVYGDNLPSIVDENAPFRATKDIYTRSKIEAEEIVSGYIRRRQLVATIIRPTIVYGPYSPVWTVNPFIQLRQRRLILIDHGQGLCNHLYVDNLVDALFMAALSESSNGEAYIVSDESPVTWREFYSFYKSILDGLGIENGWISLSREELLDLVKQKKSLAYNLKGIMKTCIGNASFNQELGQYPFVSGVKEVIKKMLPAKSTKAVRSLRGPHEANGGGDGMARNFDPPDPRDINFISLKSIFSIKKAKENLGYAPKVGIREGMDFIKQWYSTLF